MAFDRTITLLWALRSRCGTHGCLYCYFGTIDEHRESGRPTAPGVLSHLSPDDLTTAEILAFAGTLADSAVGRVFLAGGEPLLWRGILTLVEMLKQAGIEVVVCTSGVALNRPDITEPIVALGVDAVSVSLDSADPVHNDTWRPPHKDGDGWERVVSGITTLLAARRKASRPRVGIYSVITARNIPDVTAIPHLAASLGCDYAVPQPISLAPDHRLHDTLALTPRDLPALRAEFEELYAAGLPLRLPAPTYAGQVATAVQHPTSHVVGCFGGNSLFFIEPDGSVWDCPSSLKIAATAEHGRSIRGATADELFGTPAGCGQDCALFSVDCVNMWPLTSFDGLLATATSGTTP